MRLYSLPLLLLFACPIAGKDSGDPVDTGGDTDTDTDTGGEDTADTGTEDTADTGGEDTADTGTEDTADTGTEDTADTGGEDTADTGTEDTADTGTEDTADTGSEACTDADLVLTAEARTGGVSATSFGPRDSLEMVAILTNPCAADVTFETATSCLFTGWETSSSSGMGMGVAVACASVITSWTLAAGASTEEAQSWGSLSVDSYVLTVQADVPGGSASLAFTVL